MTVFRVGMRVRLVRPRIFSENTGATGRIAFLGPVLPGTRPPGCAPDYRVVGTGDCVVMWDSPVRTKYNGTRRVVSHTLTSSLEPIQDRPQLSTWDAIRELGLDVHAAAESIV